MKELQDRQSVGSATANYALLVLAPNDWNGQWVNRQQLMSRLGRVQPILYSTGGWFTWDFHSSAWRHARWFGEIRSDDNVCIDSSPRLLVRVPRLHALDDVVVQMQAYRWRRVLRSLGPERIVAYIFHPRFWLYAKRVKADHIVYHAYDLHDHTPGWNDRLERDERALLKAADIVIASSEQIAQALRSKVEREVRVLPNGADVAGFNRAIDTGSLMPADLDVIPRPRLGYVGSLHPQVDYALIRDLAVCRTDWNFVFVGPIVSHPDARADADRIACAALPNVHFLGEKTINDVPVYMLNMDVNLMCYRLSEDMWIKAVYPLKLHEYLATGRPIVSADIPAVRPFTQVVRIADGVEDWHQAIEDALQSGGRGSPAERRAVAANNSWDKRVETLKLWLGELAAREQICH